MKTSVIILVALFMLFKPLWPIAEYVINYEYISNTLCENKDKPQLNCNGKCYLSKLLAQENNQNEDNPFESFNSKIEIPLIQYVPSTVNLLDSTNDFVQKGIVFYVPKHYTSLFVFELIHPPQSN